MKIQFDLDEMTLIQLRTRLKSHRCAAIITAVSLIGIVVKFELFTLQCGDRLYTPESDVSRRQILT